MGPTAKVLLRNFQEMHFHEWFDYNIRIIILRQLKLSKKTIDSLNFQAGFCFWHLMDEYSIYCCESLTKSKRHYENFVCCENTLKRNYYKSLYYFANISTNTVQMSMKFCMLIRERNGLPKKFMKIQAYT